jgi:hypothetical protein
MFYGVFYYAISDSRVILAGYYSTLDEAKNRLNVLLPNYQAYYRNTVKSLSKVGWINEYDFGDINITQNTCDQPYLSINLF